MKAILFMLPFIGAALLTSCYGPDFGMPSGSGGYGGPNYGRSDQRGNYNSQQFYRMGNEYGVRDARNGQKPKASRYWNQVPAGARDNFVRGYKDGYRNGTENRRPTYNNQPRYAQPAYPQGGYNPAYSWR